MSFLAMIIVARIDSLAAIPHSRGQPDKVWKEKETQRSDLTTPDPHP